jgi:hypothetical protein
VCPRTVKRQRALLKQLKKEFPESWLEEVDGKTWRQVLRMNVTFDKFTEDDRNEQLEELVQLIRTNIPKRLINQQEDLVIEALLLAYPSMEEKLVAYCCELPAAHEYMKALEEADF